MKRNGLINRSGWILVSSGLAVLVLWWSGILDRPERPKSGSSGQASIKPRFGHEQPARGSSAARNPTPAPPTWIPPDAKEVVARSAAANDAPPLSGCREVLDPISIAKELGTEVDSALASAFRIPDEEESKLGLRLERELPNAAPFLEKWNEPAAQRRYGSYLQSLVDQLAKEKTRPGIRYRVHVVREPTFNAFALPGGVLAVHTGALEGPLAVRDEAELAAVLGHEIAHVELRHTIMAFEVARALVGRRGDEVAAVLRMLRTPLSSAYEHDADKRGLHLAAKAHYDPFAPSRLWARKARSPSRRPSQGLEASRLMDRLLRSHPPPRDRCSRTREEAIRLTKTTQVARWYRGASNLKVLTPGFLRAF